jgi:hypothetical protein
MEIRERVYRLDEREGIEDKQLLLIRNRSAMVCPFEGDRYCGEWCPAFQIERTAVIQNTYVSLKCFPQEVVYQITDKE